MEEIEYRLLGPVEAWRGTDPVRIEAPRQRALLAALLLEAGHVVSLDRLVAQLWGTAPPAKARNTIQSLVLRLRRKLNPPGAAGAGDVLITRDPGYLLRVAPGRLDLTRFEELLAQGRAALAAGQPHRAAEALRAALDLWRGEPLAGLADAVLCEVEVPRLRERRLQALEERVEADLRLGRHDDLISELSGLIAEHPLRERLHGQLMLALYRAGRQAEALGVFQALRRSLVDDLAVEPATALQRLHRQILARDPGLNPATRAGQSPVTGWDAPPQTLTAVIPRQLPPVSGEFIGRRSELGDLDAILARAVDQPAAVFISTLSGTAGVGKTALAVHWTHRAAGQFPDGQLYVNLRGFDPTAPVVSPARAIRGFLDALGVPERHVPTNLDAQVGLYRSLLSGRRVLVLIDNARDAGQIRPLLPAAAGCLVVVTSRNQLPSLVAAEGAHPLVLDLFTRDDARQLLVRRLGPGPVAAEPEAVEEIIARCAGLPLALAIVAARAATHPGFPLRALVDEMREAVAELDSFAGDDASINLRALFSCSYRTLAPEAARLFRLLGLHPGPDITAPAAASLAGIRVEQVRPLLAGLAQAHLITEQEPGRYTSHDLLRAYTIELAYTVDSDADRRAAMERMLDHYLHTAHAADRLSYPHREPVTIAPARPATTPEHLADRGSALAWFTAEQSVLLAAITQAAKHGFDRHAWQLAWTMADFLNRRGDWPDLAATQRIALEAARRLGDQAGQAYAHRALARVGDRLGRYDEAYTHLQQALDLFVALGDRAGQAYIHLRLGFVAGEQDRHRQALSHTEQSLDLFRAIADPAGEANALNAVGWLHAQLGDYQQAITCCGQALALHVKAADQLGQAVTQDSLGYAHHHLGHHQQAITCYLAALELYRQVGDRFGEAETLVHLGDTRHATGEHDAAGRTWRSALTILDDLGHPVAEQVRAKLRQAEPA